MKKFYLFGPILFAACVASSGETIGAAVWQDMGGGPAAVYYRDGARYALEGRLQEAVVAFEQAVVLEPSNGNIYYNLGNVYSELGRWEDAVAAYRKAVSLNKKDVEAYNGLGIALSRRGVYVQAAAAFERAIDIYPKWAEPHYHLSQVRKQLGKDEAAAESYNRAVQLRPDYAARPPQPFMTAAKKIEARPRAGTEPAVSVASTPRARPAPDDTSARASTPNVERAAPATADDAVDKAARLNSADARTYYDFGLKHSRAGRHEEAVTALRQSIILDRNNPDTLIALGDAYAALGRWGESVDAYEQAARLNQNDAETYRKLGRAYSKLRETATNADAGRGAAVGARAASPSTATAVNDEVPRARKIEPTRSAAPTTSANAGRGNAAATPPPARPMAAPAADDGVDPTAVYRVGAGDVLDVRVLDGREPARTNVYKVTPAGLLDYPTLAEPLRVEGLTTDEIATRLAAELKRRPAGGSPEIAVGVREYASHAIIISGMVKDPGTKILRREGVPLYVIVAHAQPLPAAGQAVVVSRANGRSTAIDLLDTAAMNTLVRPGDVINVQARPEQFYYIAGAVRAPGQKKFHFGLTLTQAVLAAGGAPAGAGRVSLARQESDGRLTTATHDLREIAAGRTPDPALQPGDRIEVFR